MKRTRSFKKQAEAFLTALNERGLVELTALRTPVFTLLINKQLKAAYNLGRGLAPFKRTDSYYTNGGMFDVPQYEEQQSHFFTFGDRRIKLRFLSEIKDLGEIWEAKDPDPRYAGKVPEERKKTCWRLIMKASTGRVVDAFEQRYGHRYAPVGREWGK